MAFEVVVFVAMHCSRSFSFGGKGSCRVLGKGILLKEDLHARVVGGLHEDETFFKRFEGFEGFEEDLMKTL